MAVKKQRVAWGITGAGDKLGETLEIMEQVKKEFADLVDIDVFVSKAGLLVLKSYRLDTSLQRVFGKMLIEVDANSPFLAGWLQTGKYEFLLLAPASSNTVAKIALGIADSMLSNAAIMGLKAFTSVYVVPTDRKEGTIETDLPDRKRVKLRIRKEDADNVHKLEQMDGVSVLSDPANIWDVFRKHFRK